MLLGGISLSFSMILVIARGVEGGYISEYTGARTLGSIKVRGDPSEELNLSGESIVDIKDNAFENVSHIKSLNLSNNYLTELRPSPFASLTNLELLDLSKNAISNMTRPFAHLSNLKHLDLSYNIMTELMADHFFGLPKSCNILLKENTISFRSDEDLRNKYHLILNTEEIRHKHDFSPTSEPYVKICIDADRLISVEHQIRRYEYEDPKNQCNVETFNPDGSLRLNSLRIVEFQKGWFKLRNSVINHINLYDNYIFNLTSEMFNDLPESVRSVDLTHNKFVSLEKGVIVNKHLRAMDFTRNKIGKIEDDAFINTNLTTLDLRKNKLKDMKFVDTFPPTLTDLVMCDNEIDELFPEFWAEKTYRWRQKTIQYNNITVTLSCTV